MGKTLSNYNQVTFSVRTRHKPIIEEFKRLIKKDPIIRKKSEERKTCGARGLFSVAVVMQIFAYVKKRNPAFVVPSVEDISEEQIQEIREAVSE